MIRALVIMGVTGSGKSTLGTALARALGWRFVDADSLHPAANIKKMAAGIPLDDVDRIPFLEQVARTLTETGPAGIVVACSALKRRYRDQLRVAEPDAVFVMPIVTRARLQERLEARHDHFMPASLLDSQLAALEPLQADEQSVQIPGDEPLTAQVQRALAALQARGALAMASAPA